MNALYLRQRKEMCRSICQDRIFLFEREESGRSDIMIYLKRLSILFLVMLLSMPAYADRGNAAYKHGVRAERQANFDVAYENYKQAHTLAPNNAKYFVAYTRMRFKASAQRVHNGQVLRNTGALKEAIIEFQHAVDIDSSSFMAQQELRLTADMIRRQEKKSSAPKVDTSLVKLAPEAAKLVELQPISNGPITFHMVANADSVYKTIGKMAGINVLFEPDYRPQKITVDLNNVTLLDALDDLRLQSKTYWQPVSSNTILVTTDSPAKRKELEQHFMKTFYLQNISDPNQLQEAANVVGKILDVSRVQLLQTQDAIVVRGTMDQLVLADKLLADIDKPKSEVIIDVVVMEVSRNRLRTLGSTLPTTTSVAYLPGGAGVSSGTNTAGAITVGKFAISVPGGSFTALSSDSNSRVLQNPEIRVLNDEKATLRIGDRVPIATGSFASGLVGGGSVSPLISTQFQYLDVGVNIDITPHIHSDREVTLKMSLEISTVTGETSIGGITQPIIGQRRIDHSTRLADGEVNLIGGILKDSDTQSLSGYPWVSKIPILKYLFAQEDKQRQESEIVFAVTPHIVRAQEVNEANLRVVEVGTGNTTELHRRPAAPPAASIAEHTADPGKPRPSSVQALPASAPSIDSSGPTAPSQASAQNKQGAAR
jgi:general secretion pathway protein D